MMQRLLIESPYIQTTDIMNTRENFPSPGAAPDTSPVPEPQAGRKTLLADLNPTQCDAVEAPDGPLLILAGAGTGKTRVLTTRIAYKLAYENVAPWEILAVTFTNKASIEMKERIEQTIGSKIEKMTGVGTFHSISARLLRTHAELRNLRPNFTILDTDDQIRLLKQIIIAANIDEKKWPARLMAGYIDSWKNRAFTPETLPVNEKYLFDNGRGGTIYTQYQEALRQQNAVDFGDLLLEAFLLFQHNKDILRNYQTRYRHILIDEYQDTNLAQYLWVRLLASSHHNLCCVGDDDQSIYGWRGAEIGNILNFERDFPEAQIIRLEQNYRSSPEILGAASGLIAHNRDRMGKTLWTQNPSGEKICIRAVWDDVEEARRITDDVENHHRNQHPLDEIAILVRTSAQMRIIEDRLIECALPYRVVGGPRFYERAEIRDANAYFRFIAQPDDNLAFERICNRPRRGFGTTSLAKLRDAARARQISLYQASQMPAITQTLSKPAQRALHDLMALAESWRARTQNMRPSDLARSVLDESGYMEMWKNDRAPDAPGKIDNLKELVGSIDAFQTLSEYLEHIALVFETTHNDDPNKITLMTLHAAKGLEFNIVFLPGWEEGLFPHQRNLDENGEKGREEERRLAYVALTRARQQITISYAAQRNNYGRINAAFPSHFLQEIPLEFVAQEKNIRSNHLDRDPTAKSRFANHFNAQTKTIVEIPLEDQAKRPATVDHLPPHIKQGGYIFHQKFGQGQIEDIDGDKLTIRFKHAGIKKIRADFVEATS